VSDVVAVREILDLFERASGLRVNYQKSTATLIRCASDDAATAITQLDCPITLIRCASDDAATTITQLDCPIVDLPITYLGIPLTIRRPTAAQLQPVVAPHEQGRPPVLSVIPIHLLLVLGPPKVFKALEKIQRGFLWAARTEANGGNCHVNWRRVCQPISLGGLGVRDLKRTGLALRMRWLWFSRVYDARAWSGLDLKFTQEKEFFFASTYMTVGNGQRTLLWEDRWINGRAVKEHAPQLYACIPKRRRKTRTVTAGLVDHRWATAVQGVIGLQEIGQYLYLWHLIEGTVLTEEPDKLH
jgi:hypothetical protein